MNQSPFARALSEFGSRLGIDDLRLNDQGAATLRLDDAIEVNFLESVDGEKVTAFVDLGPLGEDDVDDPDALRRLLEANYFWSGTEGATLGLEPGTGSVVLAQQFSVGIVTAELLESTLQRFVEFAERGLQNDNETGETSSAAELPTVRV
jgi:hypothetical protein